MRGVSGGVFAVVDSRRPTLYLSFHGGTGTGNWNNIHAYDVKGSQIGKVLDKKSLPKKVDLRELRGFDLGPDRNLYVVNAFQHYSQVLRFSGTRDDRGRHAFIDVFAEIDTDSNPGLVHPFHLAFSPSGDLYVSAQDTNLVLRYWGPNATEGKPGEPMPLPPRLAASSGRRSGFRGRRGRWPQRPPGVPGARPGVARARRFGSAAQELR